MRQFWRRNWTTIVAMYTGGALGSFAELGPLHWEWWVLMLPLCVAIATGNWYRERVLKVIDKW